MKNKYIILTFAAICSFACAKVEVVDNSEPDAIGFSWFAKRAVSSKADASFVDSGSSHLPDNSSFGVFGYFHPQVSSSIAGGWRDGVNNNYPNLFYNESVSVSETSGTYTYDYVNSRYWPKNTLDRISFIAYYPYQNQISSDGTPNAAAVVEPVLDQSYAHEGLISFNYQVKLHAKDHVDFMVSDMCLDQSKQVWKNDATHSSGVTGADGNADDSHSKVKFFFHHALSLVRVKSVSYNASGNDDVKFSVDSIKFNGIFVYGKCQPVPDLSSTDGKGRTTVTESWSNLLPVRPNEGTARGVTADIAYDKTTDKWDDSKYLLMIPHDAFPTGAAISVYYHLSRAKDANTGEYYSYENNVLSAKLAQPSCSAWEAGKIYTYNITLNLKAILLTATVEDWLPAGEDVFMEETT